MIPDDFNDYIKQEKKIINHCRVDLNQSANPDVILNANIPFEYHSQKPTDRAIILFHGLLDSPLTMQDLGIFFSKQGYLVRGIRLPGHGTRPADLVNITLDDWIQCTNDIIDATQKVAKNIYLLGFSAGASLALYHGLIRNDIQGIVTLAPSFKLINKAAYLSGLIHVYGKYRGKMHWFNRQAELDYARYECFPANLASQALKLAKLVKKTFLSKPLNIPWQLVLTDDDETICSKMALKLFKELNHHRNQALIYRKKLPKENPDKAIEYRISTHLQENILDFSHISLPVSPKNTHYGLNGDQQHKTLSALNTPLNTQVMKGAISKYNRQHYHLQRLTYNPDFNYMTNKIKVFLERS